MKTKTSLIMACGLTLAALPAFAGDADDKFKLMDTDGDGRVTRAEHTAGALTMFGQLDANADGFITAVEMNAARDQKKSSKLKFWGKDDEKPGSDKIALVDINGDGMLSRAEHDTASDVMFARIDADGDGVLSKDECEKGHKLLKKDK